MVGMIVSVYSNNVWGENLVKYFETNDGTVSYYDKDSVKQTSKIVKVWFTIVYGDSDKKDTIENLRNGSPQGFEKLSYSKSLSEIDCKEEIRRTITFTYYDSDGRPMFTLPYDISGDWQYIVPESMSDKLKRSVCR